MKKQIRITILTTFFVLMCFILLACNGDKNTTENTDKNPLIHSVKIDNEALFHYYFSFDSKNVFTPYYNFGTAYGTKSVSTITITPKLTGFVDYYGYVVLMPETNSETKSEQVLKDRQIQIEYLGLTSDVCEVANKTQQYDNTISFNDINYKFSSANILVTYHHEGVSGNMALSYQSILLTKYNYSRYLTLQIQNRSYQSTMHNEISIEATNTAYVNQYALTFSISPSSEIKGYVEFNNVVLTFNNGIIIKLDAIGKATYQSTGSSVEPKIPSLSKIVGSLDFYPPATYTYPLYTG